MGKKLTFPTRSFGSESTMPAPDDLAEWVSGRRGREGDLITYHLEETLLPQIGAKIDSACAGGLFYTSRLSDALTGVADSCITAEIGCDSGRLADDAEVCVRMKKGVWFCLPAPNDLGIRDEYYGDSDEAGQALYGAYKVLARSMRDKGIHGHVLAGTSIIPEEMEALSGKKIHFLALNPSKDDIETILEFQRDIAVFSAGIPDVIRAMDEYEVGTIILLDPDRESLLQLLEHRDADTIMTGGYCPGDCRSYWGGLVRDSSIST
jgi:hypothetical protein